MNDRMPSAWDPSRAASVVSVRDFPIPLMSGGIAVIQVPFPMTEDDFLQLQSTLDAWKPALTHKLPSPATHS